MRTACMHELSHVSTITVWQNTNQPWQHLGSSAVSSSRPPPKKHTFLFSLKNNCNQVKDAFLERPRAQVKRVGNELCPLRLSTSPCLVSSSESWNGSLTFPYSPSETSYWPCHPSGPVLFRGWWGRALEPASPGGGESLHGPPLRRVWKPGDTSATPNLDKQFLSGMQKCFSHKPISSLFISTVVAVE